MARSEEASFFPDGGAAGAAMRAFDWSKTSLGAPATWPGALRGQVRAMLNTRQPICIFWGRDLVNLYNDGFLPILGEKHPQAMGQPAAECWKEAWSIVGPQLAQVMAGGNIFHEEVVVPIARGGRVEDAWWNYSYSPLFDDEGAISGVLVICTEVTNEVLTRRDAEHARQELHGILDQAPLPMCILAGPEHRYMHVNAPMRKISSRDVEGKTLREVFNDEELARYLPMIDRVYETGEPEISHETAMQLRNDRGEIEQRITNIGYYPHRDGMGTINGVIVVVHDITGEVSARKQLQDLAIQQSAARKQAEALRQQAESANRAKDEFLATVSHELRTPLTAILGWARILADTSDRGRVEKGLSIIERNARAQAKIIDDILDVSRIISGKLRLAVKPVDVASMIHAVVDSVRPAATAKEVDLRVDINVKTPLVGDEDRLQQIVWNLLSNAVKFTPRGGDVIVKASEQARQVRFTVRDTGRGITPAFLPYVFERFRQDDASSTKQHAGLGLGLAIVRHLVELHGGTVSAQSEGEGRGATFEVTLPIRTERVGERDNSGPLPLEEPEALSRSGQRLQGLRVLVVDDEDDARELVAVVLEDAGAHVLQASSAAAAVSLLDQTEVAAIVSDIAMPNEDGYALLERLRAAARTSEIPALALTAFARAEDRERALASGFQDHIAKPIDPAKLVAGVAALVRRP